jgi:hypothetical protein
MLGQRRFGKVQETRERKSGSTVRKLGLGRTARLTSAIALAILLMGMTAPSAVATHGLVAGYAVQSDGDDQLYRINLATGATTAIGPTGFGDVEALTFAPNGTLYAVDDVTDQLLTCNIQTGTCSVVGPLGVAITDMGLTFDDAGNLWMSVDAPTNFYRVNPATGQATLVGPQGQEVTALADRWGTVYGLGGDGTNNLVTINTATGDATPVGPLGTVTLSDGGLDFAGSGTLYGIHDGGQWFTVNPATGAATVVAAVPAGFEGLAILNHAPVANADRFGVRPGQTLTVPSPGVLANDADPDNDPLTAQLATGPSNGTVTLNPNGGFTYTPAAGFVGTDTFTYRARDGADLSSPATVTISVGACRGTAATHVGTNGNDVITGTGGNDVILTLNGKDRVNAGGGKDLVCLGRGKDSGRGASGNDRLFGQAQNDKLNGGSGRDLCHGGGGRDKGRACEKERSIP